VYAERGQRAEHDRDRRASAAAFSDSQSACCIAGSWIAGENHFVVKPEIGQLCTFDLLNA
jgi:hypothetical protein